MDKFRLNIMVALNGNHALSQKQLKALKPAILRGVAACLPASLSVDAISVTKIKDASEAGGRK
jgi:hypothetical protein